MTWKLEFVGTYVGIKGWVFVNFKPMGHSGFSSPKDIVVVRGLQVSGPNIGSRVYRLGC